MKYKYFKQYRVKDIFQFLKNSSKKPKECYKQCHGKTVVITGATSGIGYATARLYASKGADLFFINRNKFKSEALCEELTREFKSSCDYLIADFSDLSQIKDTAKNLLILSRIDILIHNAGIYVTKKSFSKNNIELVFQVNHLGAFIINYLLKERLIEIQPVRIIYVNSEGHRFALSGVPVDDLAWKKHRYTGLKSYGAAKTAQLLTMKKFHQFFSDSNVTINAMHPGNVLTAMGQNNEASYRFMKKILIDPMADSPDISAKALYYLGVSEDVANTSGKFFNLTTEEKPAPHALDVTIEKEIWEKSIALGEL